MRNRTAIVVLVSGLVAWVGAVIVLVEGLNREGATGEDVHRSAAEKHEHATEEGPPVIRFLDLESRGFDQGAMDAVEPHFHVLNAALVTLVELREQHDTATTREARTRLRNSARSFHWTADRHEEMIEGLLADSLRDRFHAYMREREKVAGLQDDEDWHGHGQSGEARLLEDVPFDTTALPVTSSRKPR